MTADPANPCGPANAWVYGQIIGVSLFAIGVAGCGLWWLGRRLWARWHGRLPPLTRHEQLLWESRQHTQAILDRMDAEACQRQREQRRREEHP